MIINTASSPISPQYRRIHTKVDVHAILSPTNDPILFGTTAAPQKSVSSIKKPRKDPPASPQAAFWPTVKRKALGPSNAPLWRKLLGILVLPLIAIATLGLLGGRRNSLPASSKSSSSLSIPAESADPVIDESFSTQHKPAVDAFQDSKASYREALKTYRIAAKAYVEASTAFSKEISAAELTDGAYEKAVKLFGLDTLHYAEATNAYGNSAVAHMESTHAFLDIIIDYCHSTEPGSEAFKKTRQLAQEVQEESTAVSKAAGKALNDTKRADAYYERILATPKPKGGLPKKDNAVVAAIAANAMDIRTQQEVIAALELPYQFQIIRPDSKVLDNAHVVPQVSGAEAAEQLRNSSSVCLGDLHGSYIKLLETLVAANLIRISRDDAITIKNADKALVQLIEKDRFLKQDETRKAFHNIVNHLAGENGVFSRIQWTGGDRELVLIGDVLGDRGATDLLTLALLKKLPEKNIIRIFSNHDEMAFRLLHPELLGDEKLHGYLPDQVASLIRSLSLEGVSPHPYSLRLGRDGREYMYEGLPSEKMNALAPADLYREAVRNYVGSSQLFHFDTKSKTFYSHAPITVPQVENLIEAMKDWGALPKGTQYKDITQNNFATFVDRANLFFAQYVNNMVQKKGKEDPALDRALCGLSPIFRNLVWSRLDWNEKSAEQWAEEAPFQKLIANWVFGHDTPQMPHSMPEFYDADHPFVRYLRILKDAGVNLALTDNSVYRQPGFAWPAQPSVVYAIA